MQKLNDLTWDDIISPIKRFFSTATHPEEPITVVPTKRKTQWGHWIPVEGDLPKGFAEKMARTTRSPCHDDALIPGPSGGMSQNCWCATCHARYNVVFGVEGLDWGQCTDVNDIASFERRQ